ncbi:CRISPR-associated endonuclease Cas2 [Candidatus Kaiserbacteria bacterium]|nr:CRISPR-associated endonuclease Cas2 [Candidatus Kaiserbacteria bacterium]
MSASSNAKTPLERVARRRTRRGLIERAVISTLAVGGMLTIAMMAPKILTILKREHLDYVMPADPKQRLRETMSRMKRKGWVRFEEIGSKRYPRLTALGRKQVGQISLGTLSIRKPLRWDRRWRIVIFDIEERRKNDRAKIRHLLQQLGFLRLQNSVWVHPHDCEEIVALIKTDMRIGRDVLYVIADAIEFDKPLRQHFGLPMTG